MAEKRNKSGICHTIYRYAETNKKSNENYNKCKVFSYLMYLDANDLYGWAMSQKLPVVEMETKCM